MAAWLPPPTVHPHLGAVLGHRLAARGARRVGGEPHVDTLDVKAMVAFGQHPNLVPIQELTKAYRAIRGSHRSLRAVHRHRDVAERRLPQPLPPAAAARIHPGRAPQHASHDGVYPESANQSAQQRRQYDHHVCVEIRRSPAAAAAAVEKKAARPVIETH